jgi:hypothetical protein
LRNGRALPQDVDYFTEKGGALVKAMRACLLQVFPSREADEAILVNLQKLIDIELYFHSEILLQTII